MNEQNNDLFKKLGVDIGDGKINIDMNQTKDFFNSLKTMFEGAAENIKSDLAEGKVDMAENVGIKIDKENVTPGSESFIDIYPLVSYQEISFLLGDREGDKVYVTIKPGSGRVVISE